MKELSEMSLPEFVEWQLYYERESFGHDLDRLQGGMIAAVMANINRDSKRNPRQYQARDFTVAPPPPPYISPETLGAKIGRKL